MMSYSLKRIRQASSLHLVLRALGVRLVVTVGETSSPRPRGVGPWVIDGSSTVNKTDQTMI